MENQPANPLYDAQVMAHAIAAQYWQQFTDQEKTLVRFGMFPRDKMERAEIELNVGITVNKRDASRLLACALMDCAKADGGMRA